MTLFIENEGVSFFYPDIVSKIILQIEIKSGTFGIFALQGLLKYGLTFYSKCLIIKVMDRLIKQHLQKKQSLVVTLVKSLPSLLLAFFLQ